jgi:hypothetical protein
VYLEGIVGLGFRVLNPEILASLIRYTPKTCTNSLQIPNRIRNVLKACALQSTYQNPHNKERSILDAVRRMFPEYGSLA